MRSRALFAALSFVAACGGQVLDPTTDAQAPPHGSDGADAGGWCDVPASQRTIEKDTCDWSATWSSGGVEYGADCACPVGVCTCTKNGEPTTVSAPAVCPPCYLCGDYTGVTPVTACGFPGP